MNYVRDLGVQIVIGGVWGPFGFVSPKIDCIQLGLAGDCDVWGSIGGLWRPSICTKRSIGGRHRSILYLWVFIFEFLHVIGSPCSGSWRERYFFGPVSTFPRPTCTDRAGEPVACSCLRHALPFPSGGPVASREAGKHACRLPGCHLTSLRLSTGCFQPGATRLS